MDGAEGVGEGEVLGAVDGGGVDGEAVPVVGVVVADGVVQSRGGRVVDGEVECDDGVAVGNGADGVDDTRGIAVVPAVVDPSHRVAYDVTVGVVVCVINGEREVDDGIALGAVGEGDERCRGGSMVGVAVLPGEAVAAVEEVDGGRGVVGVDRHHHQRVNAVETAEMDAVAHRQHATSVWPVGKGDAVPYKRQGVLAEVAVVVGAAVALEVEGAQRVAGEDGIEAVQIDSGGVVDGALKGIVVAIVDGVVKMLVVGGPYLEVEGACTVAGAWLSGEWRMKSGE